MVYAVKMKITNISFLSCRCINQMRGEMVLTIQQKTNMELTTDVLLIGTEAVSEDVNASIFKALQKYIKLFKHFSQFNNKNYVDRFWVLGLLANKLLHYVC